MHRSSGFGKRKIRQITDGMISVNGKKAQDLNKDSQSLECVNVSYQTVKTKDGFQSIPTSFVHLNLMNSQEQGLANFHGLNFVQKHIREVEY